MKQELVTYEEALKHVTNPDDFALRFRGIGSTSDATWADFEGDDAAEDDDVKPEDLLGDEPDGPDDDLIQRF